MEVFRPINYAEGIDVRRLFIDYMIANGMAGQNLNQSSSAASIRRYSSAVGSKELEEALWVEEGDEDVDTDAFSLELSEELEEER